MLEARYKTLLIKRLEEMFPGCIILHNDAGRIQGIPDLLILYRTKWAALEGKRTSRSSHRPNQDYWVDRLNQMSFAAFISPDDEEEVLDGLQQALRPGRASRYT